MSFCFASVVHAEATDVKDLDKVGSADDTSRELPSGREFWSFQPLSVPPVPSTTNSARRPIDAFIDQALRPYHVNRNPSADASTKLRRATFDVTGLPPSADQVREWLDDRRGDAYERLIDRLLASPHYGEHWARFWLDLARYTDTTAEWLKSTAQAWLYRDWVVGALNQDLPYDRFVRLQLAADMIRDSTTADLPALGFLGLSPTYWKELRLAPDVIKRVVAEEWDERIDAVSRTVLGLTVSCARCHHHKFDPISMEDYYALAGVFASCQLADRPLLPTREANVVRQVRERTSALQAELDRLKDKQSARANELRKEIESIRRSTPNYDAPWAHVVEESSVYVLPDGEDKTRIEYRKNHARDLPVFHGGNPTSMGQTVPRRFLHVFSEGQPRLFQQGSGRLELANSLFDHAESLTARVIVNRVWARHFGAGIVRTPSSFGSQGARPSHPQLLDYLASELIRHDWSLKWLHREMLMSATWQQSSQHRVDAHTTDPENRLLWRMNRRRLDIEAWRDAILTVTRSLDTTMGGPPTSLDDPAHNRRMLYGIIARRDVNRLLRLFDFPEPTAHSPRREPTTTPLQQLFVLNSEFIERQAFRLAEQVTSQTGSDESHIQQCYLLLFGRQPNVVELELATKFLKSNTGTNGRDIDRWTNYVHGLFGLNEFLFLD